MNASQHQGVKRCSCRVQITHRGWPFWTNRHLLGLCRKPIGDELKLSEIGENELQEDGKK